jgi:MoaA/NifB/PqqE/SkfB family radical SAM enzyme
MHTKIKIPHIEWHVAHTCNISCQGCLHFSDYGHTGIVSYDEIKDWYLKWSHRLAPKTIDILGGEPLLNKDICKIISLTRKMWDDPYLEKLNLQTNGLLVDRFPDLPKVLKDSNCSISVSWHSEDPRYNKLFEKSKNILNEWFEKYRIQVYIVDFYNYWTRFYKGHGSTMEPYNDGDFEKSWDNCLTGQDCFQIFNGDIYKCSPLAYLPMTKQKINLSEKWDYYLTYEPLRPKSSDNEVIEFFNKGAEKFCSMCPSSPEMFKKPDPLTFRKQISIRKI